MSHPRIHTAPGRIQFATPDQIKQYEENDHAREVALYQKREFNMRVQACVDPLKALAMRECIAKDRCRRQAYQHRYIDSSSLWRPLDRLSGNTMIAARLVLWNVSEFFATGPESVTVRTRLYDETIGVPTLMLPGVGEEQERTIADFSFDGQRIALQADDNPRRMVNVVPENMDMYLPEATALVDKLLLAFSEPTANH